MSLTIKPKEGFGDIPFGWSRDEALELLGEAEQIVESENKEGVVETVAWYYWSKKFALHFDADRDWCLVTFDCHHPEARLLDQCVVGMSRAEICRFFVEKRIKWLQDHANDRFYVEVWDMNVWFAEDKVESLQWGSEAVAT